MDLALRRENSLRFIHLIYEATRDTVMQKTISKDIHDLLETGHVDINHINSRGPLLNALLVTINNGNFYWTHFLLQKGADPLTPFQLDDHIYYFHFTLSQLRLLLLFGLPLSVIYLDLHFMNASIKKYVKADKWPKEALLYIFLKKSLDCFLFC